MTMDHGQPVESLLLYPSEGLLVSAGRTVSFQAPLTDMYHVFTKHLVKKFEEQCVDGLVLNFSFLFKHN